MNRSRNGCRISSASYPEYANANGYSIFTHSWTVGVELKFYLLLPPILFLMMKNANGRFAVNGGDGRGC